MKYGKERQIERDRYSYGKMMTRIMNGLFRKSGWSIIADETSRMLSNSIELADKMHNVFDNMSDEDKRIYLDGEFPTSYLGEDNDLISNVNSPEFPLYLFTDISLMTLDNLYIYESSLSERNKEQAKELKQKLESLREKLLTLNYSPRFAGQKHVSESAWRGLNECRGFFNMSSNEKEGVKYYEISYRLTTDDGVWKNGDYYYDNVYHSYHNHILFEEDSIEISKRKQERLKNEAEVYYAHFTKYFKDGIIPPDYRTFEEYLVDPSIDPRIKKELGDFVLMYRSSDNKGHLQFAHSEYADFYVDDLQRAERQVEKDRQEAMRRREEKDTAISQARARYQQRNFFWKLLNRKLNPEKLEFETMETPEIQELYTGGKKRK